MEFEIWDEDVDVDEFRILIFRFFEFFGLIEKFIFFL